MNSLIFLSAFEFSQNIFTFLKIPIPKKISSCNRETHSENSLVKFGVSFNFQKLEKKYEKLEKKLKNVYEL